MTKEVFIGTLREHVAQRLLSEIEDHGGLDEFCEKLQAFPEQYLLDLATGALDCLALSECLHPRVTYQKNKSTGDPITKNPDWQCPIGYPDCTNNCGNYGCGN